MSISDTRYELLTDKEKVDSFIREFVNMLLLCLASVDEKHPILQFGQVFRDCNVTVTVSLDEGEEEDDLLDEPSIGHPTITKAH